MGVGGWSTAGAGLRRRSDALVFFKLSPSQEQSGLVKQELNVRPGKGASKPELITGGAGSW